MRPTRVLRFVLVLIGVLIAGALVLGSEKAKTPKFTANDHKAIEAYYTEILGKLAPGSLDRVGFSPEIERALAVGEKLPLQLEKKLETLPKELEEKLSAQAAGYQTYKLGHHVLILRRSDLEIADIIKDAGWAENGY